MGHPPLLPHGRLSQGRRVVIHFHFTDAPARERLWWLVVENATTDLCRDDPGHELDVIVECTVRALTELWTGDSDPATRDDGRPLENQRRRSGWREAVAVDWPQHVRRKQAPSVVRTAATAL